MEDAVIVSAVRTPVGSFAGQFKDVPATELGAHAVSAALERAGISGEEVDEVVLGCVLQAGLGQNPARQAAIGAGLPNEVPATTVNMAFHFRMQASVSALRSRRSPWTNNGCEGGEASASASPVVSGRVPSLSRGASERVSSAM